MNNWKEQGIKDRIQEINIIVVAVAKQSNALVIVGRRVHVFFVVFLEHLKQFKDSTKGSNVRTSDDELKKHAMGWRPRTVNDIWLAALNLQWNLSIADTLQEQ